MYLLTKLSDPIAINLYINHIHQTTFGIEINWDNNQPEESSWKVDACKKNH